MGHCSPRETHYVNLGTRFTYLYFPALSNVCPTFILFHCEQTCVLTLPIAPCEWLSEADAAVPVAQGL